MFQKKLGRLTNNKDFPRGQVNGFADNWNFEKIETWDRLKINTASTCPAHLAHAIATQTHRYTKAMARAKSPTTLSQVVMKAIPKVVTIKNRDLIAKLDG